MLLEVVESLSFITMYNGLVPTSPRTQSFLNITFMSPELIGVIDLWKVINEESLSEHQYIFFSLKTNISQTRLKREW